MQIEIFLDILFSNDLQYSPEAQVMLCQLRGTSNYVCKLISDRYIRKSIHIPNAYANLLYYELIYCWFNPDYLICDFGDLLQIKDMNINYIIHKCSPWMQIAYAWIYSKHNMLDKCEALKPYILQKSIYKCYKLSKSLRHILHINDPRHVYLNNRWFRYTNIAGL
jgi:hypothetical protein